MKKLSTALALLALSSLALAQTYDANGRQKVNVETGAVTVSGTVTANAGTGTLAVSGPLTDTQLRATAVPVSGTFWQATQPVSGTVTANAGTGTFTVGDGAGALNVIVDSGSTVVTQGTGTNLHVVVDTAPTTAVTGTFWQTTQPVSASALPLPTGASTLAEQQTQTTALQIIDGLPVAQGSTTSGQIGALVQGAVTTSAPTYTTAQTSPLSLTTTGSLRVDLVASSATGAAPPGQAMYTAGLGSGATGGFLLGIPVCDTFANVNVSTATTTLLVTGVSGRHVRICSLSLVTAAANNVALISGTGATCGTGSTGMTGGTTAATGWNFAANGGLTQGSGLGTINQTNATGDSVCVVTSAATQLSGRLSYSIY